MKKLFLLMFIMVFLVVPISAEIFTIDNKLTYSNEDLKVDFNNLWGFGKYYGSIELKSHPSVNYIKEVGAGNPVVMWYDFQDWEYYKDGLGEVIFTDKKTGEIINRDYSYVYWGDKIRDVYGKGECNVLGNQTQVCETIVVGTETYKDWLSYNSKDIPKGNIRIGIKVEVRMGDYVDGVWEIVGKKVSKHSIWTASLNAQLVNYWKLDGTVGVVVDSIGNNDGSNNGTTRGVVGKINNSFDFPNVRDNVSFAPNGSLIDFELNYTIGFWMNSSTNDANRRIIFAHSDTATGSVMAMGLKDGEIQYKQLNDAGGTQVEITGLMGGTIINEWRFVVVRHFANGTSSLFSDNSPVSGGSAQLVPVSGTKGFFLGLGTVQNDGRVFDGLIDEVGVWARVLTDAELTQIWNEGNGITFTDVFSPNITLNSPIDTFDSPSQTINFNATVFDLLGNNIVSVNLSIDGIFNETNISGINNTDYIFTKTLSFATHNWTIDACDDAGICSNSGTRTLTISRFIENSQTFNTSSFETAKEIFTINITTDGTTPTSAKLIYDGTTFLSATVTNTAGNDFNISRTINIPLVNETKTWFFNFTIGGTEINSSAQTQLINLTNFSLCGAAPQDIPFINLTFKNETSNEENINATIVSTWLYSLSTISSINKTLVLSDTTENANYTFCSNPPTRTLNVELAMTYSNSISQQRGFTLTSTLLNISTTKVLFLLPTNLGLFSQFTTVDVIGRSIENVKGTITRTLNGNPITVASGFTDGSGLISFFLNPNILYTGTFEKSGFLTISETFFPVIDLRTVTMISSLIVANGSQISLNGTYQITPTNTTLINNTNVTFGFNVTSGEDITLISMNITNITGSQLLFVSNAGTGFISGIVNTSNNIKLIGISIIQTGDETQIIQRTWLIVDTFIGDYSIFKQFTLFTTYGFSDFIRLLIVILVIIGVLIFMTTGEIIDTSESKIIVSLLLIWAFSIVGWLDTNIVVSSASNQLNTLSQLSNQYGIAMLTTAGGLFFILRRIFI